MMNIINDELIKLTTEAAVEGGKEILKVYEERDTVVWEKDDKSPLTQADINSNKAIMSFLSQTDIPVLSEECRQENYTVRKNWTRLWVVDPLDGTKEFVKRNGEFTVNIALVENGQPLMGVIFVPVKKELFIGKKGVGAFKAVLNDDWRSQIEFKFEELEWQSMIQTCENDKITLVVSKSHFSEETGQFVSAVEDLFGEIEAVSAGSSLKLCLVADGKSHAYPRFAPTMEWDTAAGHAIITAMGGKVLAYPQMEEMNYNKENLLNSWFICVDGGQHTNKILDCVRKVKCK